MATSTYHSLHIAISAICLHVGFSCLVKHDRYSWSGGVPLSESNLQRIGKQFFFSFLLQGYMAHRNLHLGFAISNTDVPAVDFFPWKQFTKLSSCEDQQIGENSHLLIQKFTRPSIGSFFYSSIHNALRFSVHLALWRHAHLFSSKRQVSSGDLFKRQRLD